MGKTTKKRVPGGSRGQGNCSNWQSDEVATSSSDKSLQVMGREGMGRWWSKRIGQAEDARCPRCGLDEETSDHIVFQCTEIRRVKDEKGRRE